MHQETIDGDQDRCARDRDSRRRLLQRHRQPDGLKAVIARAADLVLETMDGINLTGPARFASPTTTGAATRHLARFAGSPIARLASVADLCPSSITYRLLPATTTSRCWPDVQRTACSGAYETPRRPAGVFTFASGTTF